MKDFDISGNYKYYKKLSHDSECEQCIFLNPTNNCTSPGDINCSNQPVDWIYTHKRLMIVDILNKL